MHGYIERGGLDIVPTDEQTQENLTPPATFAPVATGALIDVYIAEVKQWVEENFVRKPKFDLEREKTWPTIPDIEGRDVTIVPPNTNGETEEVAEVEPVVTDSSQV